MAKRSELPMMTAMDRVRAVEERDDSLTTMVQTTDVRKAIKAAKRAKGEGRIEMREPNGRVREFTAHDYDDGRDRWHGLTQYYRETYGSVRKKAPAKKKAPGKRIRSK